MPDAVRQFEQAFGRWLGVRHAFAFWKGRVALYAILRTLGVGEGDEVVLPGYTCVMDVNPIRYLGARPVYIDIEPVTYNIDVRRIEEKITPRTRVLIAQHTYGYPCEMDAMADIAARRRIILIEDCCLALGSQYRGKLCGTFGAAAYWSFQWNKPFTTGIGGMVTTDDADLAAKIASLVREELAAPLAKAAWMLAAQRLVYRLLIYPRTTAFATAAFRWLTRKGAVVGSSSTCEFEPTMPPGFFVGMSAGQARAGLRQLGKIDRNLAHRRRMREIYDRLLRDAGWPVPDLSDTMDPVLVRYPVRVADKARAVAEAPKNLVELGTWFECPLHPIETPLEKYDYRPGLCPEAEKACREVVNLPTHPRAGAATARRSVRFLAGIGPAPKLPRAARARTGGHMSPNADKPDARKVHTYFDRAAVAFDTFYDHKRTRLMQWVDRTFRSDMFERFRLTFEILEPLAGKGVLDVGCGSGPYVVEAARRGARRVVGLDMAGGMIDLARHRAAAANVANRCKFVVGTFPADAPSEVFDYAIVMGVMDYVSDPLAFLAALRERVMERTVLSFPSRHWFRTPLRRIRYWGKRCPVYFYDEPQIRDLAAQAGFARVDVVKIRGAGMDYVATCHRSEGR